MSAAFWSDLLASKKMLLQQIISALIIAACVSIPIGNGFIAIPVVVVSIAFSTAFALFAYDEQNDWQGFRVGMPISRKDIVQGRVAFAFALVIASTLLGVVAYAILCAASGLFVPILENVFDYPPDAFEFAAVPLAIAALASAFIAAVMIAVMIPIIARFGMTKAVRYIPLAFVAISLAAFICIVPTGLDDSLATSLEGIMTNSALVIALLIALTVITLAIASFIAAKIYEKREF